MDKYISPNFNARRNGAAPDMIVLHYTAMESAHAALERLCDQKSDVSAHYLISNQGHVWQMVEEADRAWHAGKGSWGGVDDVNSRSIGIELDNSGRHPFSEPQMLALEHLMNDIMQRWDISRERVIAHSDMAPERKSDPGPRFDWRRLAHRGLSIWPDAPLDTKETFENLAGVFGFSPDSPLEARLKAFRHRFRPFAHGPLSEVDTALMAALAARWPARRNL